jgi:hypothetical protein
MNAKTIGVIISLIIAVVGGYPWLEQKVGIGK